MAGLEAGQIWTGGAFVQPLDSIYCNKEDQTIWTEAEREYRQTRCGSALTSGLTRKQVADDPLPDRVLPSNVREGGRSMSYAET